MPCPPHTGAPVVASPTAKAHKLPCGTRHTAAPQQQQPPAFSPFSFMLPPAAPAPQAAAAAAAPVMSECGAVSLSTAQFEFPAPSEDTAGGAGEITSKRLPSGFKGTAAGRMFLQRMAPPALNLSTAADPDDEILSSRLMPLPGLPASLPTRSASAATFSSGARNGWPVAACQPEHSTASLASWLPGCQGTSSMQQAAAACAAEESDCEDDAVSQRWPGLPRAPSTASPAPQACHLPGNTTGPAAGSGGSSRVALAPAPVSAPTAGLCCPVSGSEESEGGAITGADLLPMLELRQGGGVPQAGHRQVGSRQRGRPVVWTTIACMQPFCSDCHADCCRRLQLAALAWL